MSQAPTSFDEAALRAELLQFITEAKFLVAVTQGADGYPMARTLGYLNDDFTIWLYTVNTSLKMRQFRANPKTALIWRETTPERFKFLTMKGDVEIFEDEDKVAQVWQRYLEKYPIMRRQQSGTRDEKLQRVVMKVTPVYLRAEGFGIAPPPVLKF